MLMDYPFLSDSLSVEKHETGKLPHWNQDASIQFVTFRLADSLPREKIEKLSAIRKTILSKSPNMSPDELKREYQRRIGPIESRLLDAGFGECILQFKPIRKSVEEAIFFLHGKFYQIIAFVIMPNHVHLLIHMLPNHTIFEVMKSIKGFSARKINENIGQEGKIWQCDYFDRIIRNREHYDNTLEYIKANPRHLPAGVYTLYINPDYYIGG